MVIPKTVDEKAPTKRVDLTTALQYGNPDGNPALLSWARRFALENLHPSVPYQHGPEVIMTGGTTDGLSKV
jgi:DNA-binding transcriptional MocR family regulator